MVISAIFMEEFIESKIKGTIAETIVEEMLKDLGFYVLKLAQESIVSPLVQIENFVKECCGDLKLEKDYDFIKQITYLKKLPDFVIINKNGRVDLLEVKFSWNGRLNPSQIEVFRLYPSCNMLVVNVEVADALAVDFSVPFEELEKNKVSESLKETRFHIWIGENKPKEESVETSTITFKEWLKYEFNIGNDKLIEKYEKKVEKWLGNKNN